MSINTQMSSLADAVRAVTGYTGTLGGAKVAELAVSDVDGALKTLVERTVSQYALPAGVTAVKPYMFAGWTNLESVTIPEGVTSIEHHAFSGCSALQGITLPSSLERVDFLAFDNCDAIETLTFGESVSSIGTKAVNRCGALHTITVQCAAPEISDMAFSDCGSLTDVYCAFPEGQVQGAPWGAYNATIHYNSITE